MTDREEEEIRLTIIVVGFLIVSAAILILASCGVPDHLNLN